MNTLHLPSPAARPARTRSGLKALLPLILLLAAGVPPAQEIRHRDRIAVPGVRLTRDYLEGVFTPKVVLPRPDQPVPPGRPALRPAALKAARPASPDGNPAAPDTVDPSFVDLLDRELNPEVWHDLAFTGRYVRFEEGVARAAESCAVAVSGDGPFRLDLTGEDGAWTLLGGPAGAWRVSAGEAQRVAGPAPEFCPLSPGLALGWALRAYRAAGALEIRELAPVQTSGACHRVYEFNIQVRPAGAASWQPEGAGSQRKSWRVELDESLRPVSLSDGEYRYEYRNYTADGNLAQPLEIAGFWRGRPLFVLTVTPGSLRETAPAAPEVFLPPAEAKAASDAADFSPEKIWKANLPDRMGGEAPFGSFAGDAVAAVNLQNLNLTVTIPLADYPQRGALNLPLGLSYNSKLWDAEFAFSEDILWSRETVEGRRDFHDLVYAKGATHGWRNLTGLYELALQREYYDANGRGLGEQPTGRQYKVLGKMYLHRPDGSVNELMEVDAENLDALRDPYEPDGTPVEIRGPHWESVDSSQVRVELGNRGHAWDLLPDGDRLWGADGRGGVKAIGLDRGEVRFDFEVAGTVRRLAITADCLVAGTAGAGLQIYRVEGAGAPVKVRHLLGELTVRDQRYDPALARLAVYGTSSNGSGRLAVVDARVPVYAKVQAERGLPGVVAETAGELDNRLELCGDWLYLARSDRIELYRYANRALSFAGSVRPDETVGCALRGLLRDGSNLYAIAPGVGIARFQITNGGGTLAFAELLAPSGLRSGRRLARADDRLCVLDIEAGPEAGVDLLDLAGGGCLSRTLPRTECAQSHGLAWLPDRNELVLAGGDAFVTGYNFAEFTDPLVAAPAPLWQAEPGWRDTEVLFQDGARVVFAPEGQYHYDANGNYLRLNLTTGNYIVYHDTLGPASLTADVRPLRSVLPWVNPRALGEYNPTHPEPAPATYSVPGFDGELAYQLTWQPLQASLEQAALTSRITEEFLDPAAYPCLASGATLFGPDVQPTGLIPKQLRGTACYNPTVLAALTLPNGQSYRFEYDAWGELTKITYPTGGYERFEYGEVDSLSPQTADQFKLDTDRGVRRRYRSATGAAADESVNVYSTERIEGGAGLERYVITVRTEDYFDSAAAADLPGATPERRSEHYFFHHGFYELNHQLARRFHAWGLEHWLNGQEYETRLYAKDVISGALKLRRQELRQIEAGLWDPARAIRHPLHYQLRLGWRNPLTTATLTLLADDTGLLNRASLARREYERRGGEPDGYFRWGRLRAETVYDYVAVPSSGPWEYIPLDGLDALLGTLFDSAPVLQRTEREYLDEADYLDRNLSALPAHTRLLEGDGTVSRESWLAYDQQPLAATPAVPHWQNPGPVRGNLTSVRHWLGGTGSAADSRRWDRLGHVVEYRTPASPDFPEGRRTTWEYGYPDGGQGLYVAAASAWPGGGVELRTAYEYEPVSGKLTAVHDPNHDPAHGVASTTTFDYQDELDRLTEVVEPHGRRTTLSYDDDPADDPADPYDGITAGFLRVTIRSDHETINDQAQVWERRFDRLGRPVAEGLRVEDNRWRFTWRTYDRRGRVARVYNPAEAPDTGTPSTETRYDHLDRPVEVVNPGGASSRKTAYDLAAATGPWVEDETTDENNHWKRYARDAAGRIVRAWEPNPAGGELETRYFWRAGGELARVEQGGQTRTFTYDGLGQLVAATYPEIDDTFARTWEYYPDGRLWRDHRGLGPDGLPAWVEFAYDGAGRVVRKEHRRDDPDEPLLDCWTYVYDGGTGAIGAPLDFDPGPYQQGRLTAVWNNPTGPAFDSETSLWGRFNVYDAAGRVTASRHWFHVPRWYGPNVLESDKGLTDPLAAGLGFEYNLSGGLTAVTHPSGRRTTFALDLENKPTAVGDEAGLDTLVKRLEYAPHGGVVRVEVPYLDPDGLVYSREYDPARQWINRIGLYRATAPWLDFQYAYQPNGNVAAIAHPGFGGIDGEAFSYDALDRLTGVDYGPAGIIGYGYDRFGNLERRTVGLPPELCDETSFDFSGAMGEQNRLPAGAGFEYDAAGNLESIQPSAGEVEALFYDPENRLGGYERRIQDTEGEWRTVAAEMNFYGDGFERIAHRSWHYQLDTCWDTGIVTDTLYLAGPDGQVWTELSQTRQFGGCREDAAGAETSAVHGPAESEGLPPTGPTNDDRDLAEQPGGGCLQAARSLPSERAYSEQAIKYQFTDHLGSTRFTAGLWWTPGQLDIDETGVETWWGEAVLRTAEYPENSTPYGGLLRTAAPAVPVPLHLIFADPVHFTGKPTDLESGFVFFGARHYASQFCRWLSADQPFADNQPNVPQSWNLYQYVQSNPSNRIDVNGREDRPKTVVIDPGHGDRTTEKNTWVDGGSSYPEKANIEDKNAVLEKDIVINVAAAVSEELGKNFDVVLTRSGDVTDVRKKLQWRVEISNKKNADAFVSIHCNTSPENPNASGMEVFYASEEGKKLAVSITNSQKTMNLRPEPTAKNSRLGVLSETTSPAVLVEVGFLSNQNDRGKMTSRAADIGKEIGQGIRNYFQNSK